MKHKLPPKKTNTYFSFVKGCSNLASHFQRIVIRGTNQLFVFHILAEIKKNASEFQNRLEFGFSTAFSSQGIENQSKNGGIKVAKKNDSNV